ncbi:linker for activation of T-cells family member 1 [Trichomycterus rosablanca]|uniref:linker for activation of T-cells family member 1 n=1 Tax=Trichomycterus rosablanca TaxID=2290929 RepID=UPI002F360260
MDATTPLTVVGGAVFVLIILLTGLCLNCKGSGQRKYIRQQQHDPRNSFPSVQGFTIVRPYTENHSFTTLPIQTYQQQLIRPVSPCPSSDAESQSDYINQNVDKNGSSYEQPPEKNSDFPDYLDVLPDDQNVSQLNLASSLNSGQSYQNIETDDNNGDDNGNNNDDDGDNDSDSQHYINVKKEETPVGSFQSSSSDGQGSSDYVNAPKQVTIHMHLE